MFTITQWVKEFAMAAYGLDADKRDSLLRESDLPGWATQELSEQQQTALRAFNRLPTAAKQQMTNPDGFVKAIQESNFLPFFEAAIRVKFNDAYRAGLVKSVKQATDQALAETMTTQHFASYFSDALSRRFYSDYAYDVGSWTNYTYPDTAPDFRDVDRYRMSEPGTLFARREKAGIAATYVAEVQISYGVEEYARQFDVSWRTLKTTTSARSPRRRCVWRTPRAGGWTPGCPTSTTTPPRKRASSPWAQSTAERAASPPRTWLSASMR